MKPAVVLSNVEHQCATFLWSEDLRCYVGYRFVEHQPRTSGATLAHGQRLSKQPPETPEALYRRADNWLENWHTDYSDPDDPLQLQFKTFADGSAWASVVENGGHQARSWRFVPESDGIRLWMTLTTDEAIRGAYIVQQCLRFTSGIGFGFGRTVATVPFLSELLMQTLGNANGTITWVRQKQDWQPLPIPFTRYHTGAAGGLYKDSSGPVDCGLIVRESASREHAPASYWHTVAPDASWDTWSAGLYWERTAYVSNRHPADCLHAGVDFGPLAAGESRTVTGKAYWIEGSKEELFDLWQKEFG